MQKYLIILLSLFSVGLYSQEEEASFELELSTDSLLLGNYFEIRFTAENINGKMELPDFKGFEILSGPNQNSSMNIVNGVSSRTMSYSFLLRPIEIGSTAIPPAFIIEGDKTWQTNPVDITAHPNPTGIVTESRLSSDGEVLGLPNWMNQQQPKQPKKKKKLKVTKI